MHKGVKQNSCAGTGLRCHRIINLICQLVGITDIKAKVNGSVNPLNIVRATMKCLTSQVRVHSV